MIEVKNLYKNYRVNVKEAGLKGAIKNLFHSTYIDKRAIEDVSFKMEKGQTLACIGANGAGKSTLIKMLVGILAPTQGTIKFWGENLQKQSMEYRRKIGVVFGQKTNLWMDIPLIESYNIVKVIYKINEIEYKKNFDMIVELLNLGSLLSIPARKLSLGQRMKADMGMIFLHSPQILFLDEPTLGLDINIKQTIRSFIKEMNEKKETSVFLTSHDLKDIDEICKSAIILSDGKLFYDGDIEKLKNQYTEKKVIKIIGNSTQNLQLLLPKAMVKEEGQIITISYKKREYSFEYIWNLIMSFIEVKDISIHESSIEDIVAKIFKEKV